MVWMCECGCGLVSCMLLWKQWMLQKNETDVVRRGVTTAQGHVVPTPSSVALLWLPHHSLALEGAIALLYNSDGFWWTTHIYIHVHIHTSWMKTCTVCTFLFHAFLWISVHIPAVSLLTIFRVFVCLFCFVFSCLQWRNAWAPCRWGPRCWSSVAAPRDSCGSSIWTNTSPASAGGRHARMKRPRVSVVFLKAQ